MCQNVVSVINGTYGIRIRPIQYTIEQYISLTILNKRTVQRMEHGATVTWLYFNVTGYVLHQLVHSTEHVNVVIVNQIEGEYDSGRVREFMYVEWMFFCMIRVYIFNSHSRNMYGTQCKSNAWQGQCNTECCMMHHGSTPEVGMRRTIRHRAHDALRVLQSIVHCDATNGMPCPHIWVRYMAAMHVCILNDDHSGLVFMCYAYPITWCIMAMLHCKTMHLGKCMMVITHIALEYATSFHWGYSRIALVACKDLLSNATGRMENLLIRKSLNQVYSMRASMDWLEKLPIKCIAWGLPLDILECSQRNGEEWDGMGWGWVGWGGGDGMDWDGLVWNWMEVKAKDRAWIAKWFNGM